jgi:SAM-dependent methyltransferase
MRWRSIIHALSTELFGKSMPISDFAKRDDLTGIGLSDCECYALRLPTKLGYTNTFYHQAPFLDITSEKAPSFGQFDFIICSDVFEHIAQPIGNAFDHACRLLKPDGVIIFSVPLLPGETREHFPELFEYELHRDGAEWTLKNRTADGRKQQFTGLTFHGGPGTVLEMRIFGQDSLKRNFSAAGFRSPVIYSQDARQFGIVWNPNPPNPQDAPPWAARRAGGSRMPF